MKTKFRAYLEFVAFTLICVAGAFAVNAQDETILYGVADPGLTTAMTNWGLDTCWPSFDNMQRGLLYMGTNNVNIVRVGFFVDAPLTNNDVTPADKASMQTCIGLAGMATAATKWDLNLDSSLNAWYQNGSGTVNPTLWAEAMEACQRYYNRSFWSAEGFNEPDYSANGEGSPQNLDQIFTDLKASTNFIGTAMEGGSTLDDDNALSWFDSLTPNASMGSTHCLAGSAASYVNFIQSVTASNAAAFNPEMHNVMEAIMGAQYGLKGGIWWGTAELARGSFATACQGKQLGYADNWNNWTAAAVYRGTNAVQAFFGGSERMATTTTYRLFSRDRNVFYDGHGPQRDYWVTVPGGTGYQVNQPSMEQVVNITWGADIPPPISGRYVVVNRSSGLVLEVASNTTNSLLAQAAYTGSSNQIWDIYPLSSSNGGDVSYYTMTAENNGEVANLSSWSYANGINLQIWPSVDSLQQHWIFQYASNGCFYIRSRMSDLYVDASGSAIVQWSHLNGLNEQWRLIPVTNITPTGRTISFTAPAAPTGLTAGPGAVSVQLNWNANSGSTPVTYTVLSSTNSGGPYNVIARGLTTTAFVDNSANQAQTFYYVVSAVDGLLNQSAYSSQVSASPTLAPTLVADFAFQSNSVDSSGNDNDAELIGSPGFLPGLDLNGTNQYAMAPAGIMASVTNFTIAAWVYWNGGAEWQRIFDFGNNTTQYMFLTPDSGNATLRFAVTTSGNSAEQRVETSELPIGQWIHVAVTLNGNTASLYTNGVLAASGPDTIPPSAFNPALNNLGASQFPGDPHFNGLLGSICIYNYAFTASQILSMAVPSVPAPVWATAGNSQVSVAWDACIGARSYTVKRSTSNGGPYTVVASGVTNTTCTDTAVANGTTYYYVVQAVNTAGESVNSSQVIATPNSVLPDLSDYWRFDEGSGITAFDSVGTNNGTLGTGCTWTASGVDNGAVSLDGTAGACVTFPTGLVSRLTNFTIATWVYLNAANPWQRLFDFGSGTQTYMFLTPEAGSGGPLQFAITTNGSGSEQLINGPASLSNGTWHHVAITLFDGIGILYLDGTALATNSSMTITPSALGITTANSLGQSQFTADPHLTGTVDDFRIYPSAFSPQQIASLAAPASSELTMTAMHGNLVFTWNVAGANGAGTLLESNTNLENPNGWAPINGASSPYTIPVSTEGIVFYRVAP